MKGLPFKELEPEEDSLYLLDPKSQEILGATIKNIRPVEGLSAKRLSQAYVFITTYKFFRVKGITEEKLDVAEKTYGTNVDTKFYLPANENWAFIRLGVLPTPICTNKEELQKWIDTGIDKITKRKSLL